MLYLPCIRLDSLNSSLLTSTPVGSVQKVYLLFSRYGDSFSSLIIMIRKNSLSIPTYICNNITHSAVSVSEVIQYLEFIRQYYPHLFYNLSIRLHQLNESCIFDCRIRIITCLPSCPSIPFLQTSIGPISPLYMSAGVVGE